MIRNLRIGAKIALGFGIVVIFMLAISITVITTNVKSNNNLGTINNYSDFQMSANTFMSSFSDSRISSSVIYQKTDAVEYQRITDDYNSSKTELGKLRAMAETYGELSVYSEALIQIETKLDTWYGLIQKINNTNSVLDGLKASFIQTGGDLSAKTALIYAYQIENLNADVEAGTIRSEMLQRAERVRQGADIVINLNSLRRMFIRIIDLYEMNLVPDTMESADNLLESIEVYIDGAELQEEIELGEDARAVMVDYINLVDTYISTMNEQIETIESAKTEAISTSEALFNIVSDINSAVTNENSMAVSLGNLSQWLSIIISLVAVVMAIMMGVLIVRSITKPVGMMVKVAKNLADGKIELGNYSYQSKDEIGELFACMTNVVKVLGSLIAEVDNMSEEHDNGNTDVLIDEAGFSGAYGKLADKINRLVESYLKNINDTITVLKEFGNGNLKAEFEQLPGKKADLNRGIETLRADIMSASNEINMLVDAAYQGDLTKRADESKYKGDWAELMKILNRLVYAISVPIKETGDVMTHVVAGNFDKEMEGNYKGEFLSLKNSINSTVKNIRSYINEVSNVLGALASNDLDQSVDREYVGEFADIKTAINTIINQFNIVISEINGATEQVNVGSKQISESSMNLAQGATQQASTIEELTATISVLNQQTKSNAQNAKTANELSEESKKNAVMGNNEMKQMLQSMSGIKESSNNISKIIKVIEDIAFQTNLLALNAAVEAARAGEHGKGFAVVAEEVRTLASRSQNAAKETNKLINDSISKVDEGTKVATNTAMALDTILKDFERVSAIISEIATASEEQAKAISEVNVGIDQISQVIQDNTAASEESASATEELASQSELLRNMVGVFKLSKKERRG